MNCFGNDYVDAREMDAVRHDLRGVNGHLRGKRPQTYWYADSLGISCREEMRLEWEGWEGSSEA